MKYKVGDTVVLRDDVGLIRMQKKAVEIESVSESTRQYVTVANGYNGVNYSFTDDYIDHEKTTELQRNKKIAEFQKKRAEGLSIPFPPKARRMNGNVAAETNAIMEGIYSDSDAIEPPHYNKGDIDLIESWYLTMPFDGFRWAMKSHIDKYVYRYEEKNGIEDLDKAIEFIERLKEKEEEHA